MVELVPSHNLYTIEFEDSETFEMFCDQFPKPRRDFIAEIIGEQGIGNRYKVTKESIIKFIEGLNK